MAEEIEACVTTETLITTVVSELSLWYTHTHIFGKRFITGLSGAEKTKSLEWPNMWKSLVVVRLYSSLYNAPLAKHLFSLGHGFSLLSCSPLTGYKITLQMALPPPSKGHVSTYQPMKYLSPQSKNLKFCFATCPLKTNI